MCERFREAIKAGAEAGAGVSRINVTKKSVPRQNRPPGPIMAAKTGPPLPILVLP